MEHTEESRNGIRKQALSEETELIRTWLAKADEQVFLGEWLEASQSLQIAGRLATQLHKHAANVAQYEGASWAEVGEKFGISRQGAEQKFSRYRQDDQYEV